MASKNANGTLWTIALIAIVGFVTYKALPKLLAKLKGNNSGGSGGAGGAAGADYYAPYDPDRPNSSQGSGMSMGAQIGLPSLPGSKAAQYPTNYDTPTNPAALTYASINGPRQVDQMDMSDYQNATTDAQMQSDANSIAYSPDFPGTEISSPFANSMAALFKSTEQAPNVTGDGLAGTMISADQAQQFNQDQDVMMVNQGDQSAQAAIDAVNAYANNQGDFGGYDSYPSGDSSDGGDTGGGDPGTSSGS
jgi:hypothetical protein